MATSIVWTHLRFAALSLISALALSACGGGSVEPTGTAAAPAPAAARAEPPSSAAMQGAVVPIAGNAISDPSFEASPTTAWATLASDLASNVFTTPQQIGQFAGIEARSGNNFARLGINNSEFNFVSTNFVIPNSGQSAALQFYYQIRTAETDFSESVTRDFMTVDLAEPLADGGKIITTLTTLTYRDRSTGWVKSANIDLSAYKGRSVRLFFRSTQNSANLTTFYIDDVALVPTDLSSAPQTGWWLNPAEPGRGFAIEKQGNKIFMAGFFYNGSNASDWAVSTLTQQASGHYTGRFDRYTGGQTLSGAFKPSTLTSQLGEVTLTFTASGSGALQLGPTAASGALRDGSNRRDIALERFAFASGQPASSAAWQNGWWLNPAEPGRGYFLEVQGNQAFIGAFMYGLGGEPVWYVSALGLGTQQSLEGQFDQYSGGQTLFGSFKPASKLAGSPGGFGMTFGSASTGQVFLPSAAGKPMQRFIFN
jgi:hypothetical protein